MPLHYSDYLITPSDIRRAVLFVIRNIRRRDVIGEAMILAILIVSKQLFHLDLFIGLILAAIFVILYWENPTGKKLLYLLGRLRARDVLGETLVFMILIGSERYLHWQTSSAVLSALIFALCFWRTGTRAFVTASLICLFLSPVLLLFGDRFDFSAALYWGKQASAWSFYFLSAATAFHLHSLCRKSVPARGKIDVRRSTDGRSPSFIITTDN
jgi:hypothetical protein